MASKHAELSTRSDGIVDLEERTWLPRHQRGDPDAFDALLTAYQRPIYSYLTRCGITGPVRDDLFQDIFLKIHAAAASYQSTQPLRPWLFTIAANTVRNHFRKKQIPVESWGESQQEIPDPSPAIENTLDARQALTGLQQAITELPLNQRQVLILSTLEGLRQQQVADILKIPLNSVKTHLRRARLSLMKALEQRDRVGGGCDDDL